MREGGRSSEAIHSTRWDPRPTRRRDKCEKNQQSEAECSGWMRWPGGRASSQTTEARGQHTAVLFWFPAMQVRWPGCGPQRGADGPWDRRAQGPRGVLKVPRAAAAPPPPICTYCNTSSPRGNAWHGHRASPSPVARRPLSACGNAPGERPPERSHAALDAYAGEANSAPRRAPRVASSVTGGAGAVPAGRWVRWRRGHSHGTLPLATGQPASPAASQPGREGA